MKILLINNQHYPKGGAHNVYFNTAKLLSNNGHEVFFFSLKDEETLPYEYSDYFPKAKDYRNLSIISKIKSLKSFIYNNEASQKINDYIKIIKPDIAHVHLFMGGLTVSALKSLKENNIPIVHSVHDYRLVCPSYLFLNGNHHICEKCKNHKYYNCVLNKCSQNNISQSFILSIDSYFRKFFIKPQKLIDRYIYVSKFARDKHLEFSFDNDSKSSLIYNFIPDIDTIKPNIAKGKYFLYIGRLSREKGIQTLINAIKGTAFNLKVVGTGPLLTDFQKLDIDNISFLGFKNGLELFELIRNASFVIVPSEWYENNPMSIIEAYAFGKPVIGANIGGIPEILEENKTGYLFKSGNLESLSEMLIKAYNLSDAEYNDFSTQAREFAELNFKAENHYLKLLELYNETIKNNQRKIL